MAHYLLKTEPSEYSFDQLRKDKRTTWDGISNALALKHLRGARKGDQVLIYHTGSERQAVGIAKLASDPYPDPEAGDPKLVVVDLVPVKPLPRPVTLDQVKRHPKLEQHALARLPRLSVIPLTDAEWTLFLGLAGL